MMIERGRWMAFKRRGLFEVFCSGFACFGACMWHIVLSSLQVISQANAEQISNPDKTSHKEQIPVSNHLQHTIQQSCEFLLCVTSPRKTTEVLLVPYVHVTFAAHRPPPGIPRMHCISTLTSNYTDVLKRLESSCSEKRVAT